MIRYIAGAAAVVLIVVLLATTAPQKPDGLIPLRVPVVAQPVPHGRSDLLLMPGQQVDLVCSEGWQAEAQPVSADRLRVRCVMAPTPAGVP